MKTKNKQSLKDVKGDCFKELNPKKVCFDVVSGLINETNAFSPSDLEETSGFRLGTLLKFEPTAAFIFQIALASLNGKKLTDDEEFRLFEFSHKYAYGVVRGGDWYVVDPHGKVRMKYPNQFVQVDGEIQIRGGV